jgi:hypothetical protein
VALSCAFILKRFEVVPVVLGSAPLERSPRHHSSPFIGTTYEISLVVMSAYLAYLIAEVHFLPQPVRLLLPLRVGLFPWPLTSLPQCM